MSLFTGVGGVALGLHHVATPVAYCDFDEEVQEVLRGHMDQGKLPRAPIVGDVHTLASPNGGLQRHAGVCLVEGGFPCQGLSLAGRKKGLEDDRSGLLFELAKVATRLRARYVFLENVANIASMPGALDTVARLLDESGYSRFAWVCINANDVGAPCRRERWFCLAVRDGEDPPAVNTDGSRKHLRWLSRMWKRESVRERMVLEKAPDYARRIKMLGNAAIPAQVCAAWHVLTRLHEAPELRGAPRDAASYSHKSVSRVDGGPPRVLSSGAVRAYLADVAEPRPVHLVLRPGPYVRERRKKDNCKTLANVPRAEPVTRDTVLTTWPAPRTTNASGCVPSVRTLFDLGTVVAMERDTPDALRQGWVGVRWTEWLMGFPRDWTRAPTGSPGR